MQIRSTELFTERELEYAASFVDHHLPDHIPDDGKQLWLEMLMHIALSWIVNVELEGKATNLKKGAIPEFVICNYVSNVMTLLLPIGMFEKNKEGLVPPEGWNPYDLKNWDNVIN